MLKWILSDADIVIKVILGMIGITSAWWKWKGKKWYAHYIGNRNAWRVMMLDIQKSTNEITSVLSLRITNMEKHFSPNGGHGLMDIVMQNTSNIDLLISGQRSTREMLGIMHWESDNNGRVIYVSYSLCELLGCNQNQILGTSWIGLIIQEDRRHIIENWKLSVENASFFKERFTFIGCDDRLIKVKAMAVHNKGIDQKLINSLVKFEIV